jgi:hypothetical protein
MCGMQNVCSLTLRCIATRCLEGFVELKISRRVFLKVLELFPNHQK